MESLRNYVNPKNNRKCPMLSEETNDIIQRNADVSFKYLFTGTEIIFCSFN